jgi:hypothetical protein
MNYLAPSVMLKQPRRRGTHRMIEHGSISRAHVYDMLRSKEIRVRRAAFTLLEASNPRLRRDSALFMEIVQFIWDANPSYDGYQEFSKRHLFVRRHKVHELILARLERERRAQESATPVQRRVEDVRQSAPGFFQRLFGQRARRRGPRSVVWIENR